MARSSWKSPYISLPLLQKLSFSKKKVFRTYSRGSMISPKFLGFCIRVHNGKTFARVVISEETLGCKLGEFAPTRGRFEYKKKKKKKVK